MDVWIDTTDITDKMDMLKKKSPKAFNKAMNTWLIMGANKIKNESIGIAKVEAVGVTRNYMRGFKYTNIKKDVLGKFIVIYNSEIYSNVIEKGGHWNKMPPPQVIKGELSEWVQKKLFAIKKRKKKKDRVKYKADKIKRTSAKKAQHGKAKSYNWKVKQIAFAIGKALTKNKYEGKGQQFRGSILSGKLLVMYRAFRRSNLYLKNNINLTISKALDSL